MTESNCKKRTQQNFLKDFLNIRSRELEFNMQKRFSKNSKIISSSNETHLLGVSLFLLVTKAQFRISELETGQLLAPESGVPKIAAFLKTLFAKTSSTIHLELFE